MRVIVGIICAVAIALALVCLASLTGGLLRRIKALDAQLAKSRTQVAALNELLAQAPGRPS